MPFIGEDAEGYVDFDVFYSTFITDCFPGELAVCFPCETHTTISDHLWDTLKMQHVWRLGYLL
jgi:hypothetical protein